MRRIKAKTRDAARHQLNEEARALADIAVALRAPPAEAGARLEALLERPQEARARTRRRAAQDRDGRRRSDSAVGRQNGREPKGKAELSTTVAGIPVDFRVINGFDAKELKPLADAAMAKLGTGVVAVANSSPDGKASLVVAVTPDYPADQRRRLSEGGRRSPRRQGRRRPTGYGASGRSGCDQTAKCSRRSLGKIE